MFNKKSLVRFLDEDIFKSKDKISVHEETIQHMIRCSKIAYDFGKYINLDEKQLKILSKSALLHDIGKLNVNPSILYKKGKLTNFEFQEIKNHTKGEFSFEKEIRDVIKYHHERPDKKGYYGYDSSKLSNFVKIMSIIDAYDVMSNKRCYKDFVSSKDYILKDIEENINKQFDKKYALLFLDFLKVYSN